MSAAPALSVIVPAYNEEALLADAIRRLHGALAELRLPAEILLVNDGSRDRTPEIADALARELPGLVVAHQANQGIGGAFRTGAARATGDYLILWPADMPAAAEDLAPYVAEFGRADVIVGCRRRREGYNPLMLFNAWLYPKLVATLFGLRVRDVNWIHAYRRESFLRIRLTQRGIPMLAEALVRLRDQGARFAEVEVTMKARLGGVPSASRLRVMWRTLTGLFSFWWQWRREPRPAGRP
ncbi:MAG: glycosyltransferase family 2 protein [Verrucomicrobia bacterium]|jgi:dolichol-phosphate mannosyltransferase|nr:glycosyltransferase family 2 protein [Verrucomicrobiota bacterium]